MWTDDDVDEPIVPDAPAPRELGTAKGDFVVPPDFDDPLPDDVVREFEK